MLMIKNNKFDVIQHIIRKIKENTSLSQILKEKNLTFEIFTAQLQQYFLSLPIKERINLLSILVDKKNYKKDIPVLALIREFMEKEKIEHVLELLSSRKIKSFLQEHFTEIDNMNLEIDEKIQIFVQLEKQIPIEQLQNKMLKQETLELLKTIPDNSIDLIIANPPYVNSKNKHQFVEFTENWLKEAYRVLSKTGTLYIFATSNNLEGYEHYPQESGFIYANKSIYQSAKMNKVVRHATYQEYFLRFTKSTDSIYKTDVSLEVIEESRHYTKGMRPSVSSTLIQFSSNEGDTVLIPFGGTGAELIASAYNKRNWIYTDDNESFYNMANSRLKEFFNSK